MRILLAEDNTLLASAIKDAIVGAGHVVMGPAADEHIALEIATAGPPDLALLDLSLADGASGAVVATLLRNLYGTPSLFISGRPDECRKLGSRVGALGCLKKPFSLTVLLDSLLIAEALIARREVTSSLPHEVELYRTA